MSLQTQIREQIKDAMKAKDQVKLGVVKGLVANFTNELVKLERKPDGELTDEEVLTVIRRAVKQRKDSIEQFTAGGRPELAESEQAELAILETYLPAQMPREEVLKIAQAKKDELGVTDKSKAGQLMGTLMKELKGKVDGDVVKSVVDELLS
ncbi:MAG TPA: GatB/YqeY domain-containing protein [Candidatus Paceibacterota bacterium]